MSVCLRLGSRRRRLGLGLMAAGLIFLPGCDADESAPMAVKAPIAAPLAIARCRIDVEGGLIRLASQREGLIREVLVEEGDRVTADQPLARIDTRQAELRVAVAEAELIQARTAARIEQRRMAGAERSALRYGSSAGAVSQHQIDEMETEAVARRAQHDAAEAAVTLAERRLDEARFEVEARTIRAPVDGRIVRRRARPGDGVTTQTITELFQLLPDTPRIARCSLEEMFLPDLSVGLEARILLESDDRRSWPARVKRIGQVFGPPPLTDDPTARQDIRTVELILSLPSDPSLGIGQRVRGYVLAGAGQADG